MGKYWPRVLTSYVIVVTMTIGLVLDVYALDIVPLYTGSVPGNIRTAFDYAAGRWESWILNSQVGNAETVEISVDYCNLGQGVLGSAAISWDYGVGGTAYLPAQAAQFLGTDSQVVDGEIDFSKKFTWYTGTDGNTPAGQYDVVSIALHEIGHQMGFYDFYDVDNNNWGFSPAYGDSQPAITIWDQLLRDQDGDVPKPYDVESPTPVDVTGSIFFTGPNARAVNGGQDVPIYAPNSYAGGSSLSHLDEQSPFSNFLMSSSIGSGEAIHNLSVVEMGMLRDLGWLLIPEPASMFLLGAGLLGVVFLARRGKQ